jgi:hypothetical protein
MFTVLSSFLLIGHLVSADESCNVGARDLGANGGTSLAFRAFDPVERFIRVAILEGNLAPTENSEESQSPLVFSSNPPAPSITVEKSLLCLPLLAEGGVVGLPWSLSWGGSPEISSDDFSFFSVPSKLTDVSMGNPLITAVNKRQTFLSSGVQVFFSNFKRLSPEPARTWEVWRGNGEFPTLAFPNKEVSSNFPFYFNETFSLSISLPVPAPFQVDDFGTSSSPRSTSLLLLSALATFLYRYRARQRYHFRPPLTHPLNKG